METAVTARSRPDGADLLFAGDIFCDVVFTGVTAPDAGTEVFADGFRITPGGVANRAVAAARAGGRTTIVSRLGDDPLGAYIHTVLKAVPGLDTSLLRHVPGYQSPVTVALSAAEDRTSSPTRNERARCRSPTISGRSAPPTWASRENSRHGCHDSAPPGRRSSVGSDGITPACGPPTSSIGSPSSMCSCRTPSRRCATPAPPTRCPPPRPSPSECRWRSSRAAPRGSSRSTPPLAHLSLCWPFWWLLL